MSAVTDARPISIVVGADGGGVLAVDVDAQGRELRRSIVARRDLAEWVRMRETAGAPRWVWSDTARWYPPLLSAGVRVERCTDLRLCRRILRAAVAATASDLARAAPDSWDRPFVDGGTDSDDGLFGLVEPGAEPDALAELRAQLAAVAESSEPGVLALLLAAESAGSLAAAEMTHAGLPWSAERHDRILADVLGPRPAVGRPARMEAAAIRLRDALDLPTLNPDSPADLLKGLQTAGIRVTSTSSWELKRVKHPAIAPLLEYKKLARLASANGWRWLETWVRDGRFRPVYVVGGVVTGRWASDGGGALQLPHAIRGAVVADPGWRLVVADAAQLEPRVLAAMSGDAAMARAGRAADLYEGMIASGAVSTRDEAKYGMLGAIYGGTAGVSGRVLPRITRAFPRAMGLVEAAARDGESGRPVRTWLGRTSPPGRGRAWDETRSAAERDRARSDSQAWGRFTRNFVVQGTAAEWALCWLGALRRRLARVGDGPVPGRAPEPFRVRAHPVFFLHDEVVIHTPAELADEVATQVREAAAEAGRILFPASDVDFALSVAIVDSYTEATH